MRFYLPLDLRVPTLIKNQSSTANNGFLRKTAAAAAVVSQNNEPIHFSPIFKKNAFKMKKDIQQQPVVSQNFIYGTERSYY